MNIELFSCAGGMAQGFREAGIEFDLAVDFEREHCDSYEKNLGVRPVCMDVRDLLRMVKLGVKLEIDLFVADPPCTPWSRAGLRQGTEDERDMLVETCELISKLRPRRYLIGNMPGLDDSKNWPVVQRVIGGLQRYGYCVADFASLDAADYGVPQHRVRPFWFGHLEGPCIQWPAPTHGDPLKLHTLGLPGITALIPWISCRTALDHLEGGELGRPVNLRHRSQNSKQHGSVPERPARVVGTSNLSDGNVLLIGERQVADSIAPSKTIGAKMRGNGSSSMRTEESLHPPSELDACARTITASDGGGTKHTLRTTSRKHPVIDLDAPATTVRGGGEGHSAPELILGPDVKRSGLKKSDVGRVGQGNRVGSSETPCATVTAKPARKGAGAGHVIEWPWDRPSTTIQCDERIPPPGHHDENWDGGTRSMPGAVVLSEHAAAILQGFPDGWHFAGETKRARWSQIGQAMPPPLAAAVARSVAAQNKRSGDR